MTLRRIGIVLFLCIAIPVPSWAGENADRLAAAFAKICLGRPNTMSAMNKLAAAQGFALDKTGAAALAKAENNEADPFNLLLFWNAGAGDARMRVTGLISGNGDRYELGCIVDGYNVPPQDVITALKPSLGEPGGRTVKENNWIDVAWTTAGGARPGTVTLSFKDGMPRVSLTLVRILGKAAAKP